MTAMMSGTGAVGPLDGTMFSVLTFSAVQEQLTRLLADRRGRAGWWVEVARQLDNLSDAVVSAPGNVIDTEGFTEQIRSDAPHLLGRWMRLSEERDTLMASVTRVRLLVGEYAGDATAVDAVAREVEGVLTTVRRYQERTTDVLLDAYERDLGGE